MVRYMTTHAMLLSRYIYPQYSFFAGCQSNQAI